MKKKIIIILFISGFFKLNVSSQIVYTEISPDLESIINPNSQTAAGICSIDLNKDAYEEYNFRWDDYGNNQWYVHMTFYENGLNNIALDGDNTTSYGSRIIKQFTKNQEINSSLNWGNSYAEPIIGDMDNSANFLDKGDRYIGVQFQIESSIYYGWVLVNFSTSQSEKKLTIKSYAYNSTPGQFILAGEGEPFDLGIKDKEVEKLSVSPNPISEKIDLTSFKIANYNTFQLFDNSGKLIKSGNFEDEFIDASAFDSGVYLLSVQSEDTSYTLKLLKQ